MPCPSCGTSCERSEPGRHVCDPERVADYRLFQLRDDVRRFEASLRAYLESPRGRFEVWYAERERRRRRRG